MVHNQIMKKQIALLTATFLLASCASGGNGEDEGKTYIASLKEATTASLKQDSYFFSSNGSGVKFALGVKNLNDTYYHLSGSSLLFEAGAKGLKSSNLDDYEGELLLKGGTIALDTNMEEVSSVKNFLKLSPVKAKIYFDDGAVYFNASGSQGETNATLGLLVQTAIQSITGDDSYVLYGGGNRLDSQNKYKGKWTLSSDDRDEISKYLPLVDESNDYASMISSLSSFLEGAYSDPSGKTSFSFETKEDGQKKIAFQSQDKEVLSSCFASALSKGDYSAFTSSSSSSFTYEEAKEKADKFFSYTDPKAFKIEIYFNEDSLLQTRFDVNFAFDEEKIKSLYPNGMIDASEGIEEGKDPKDYQYILDSSLSFSGSIMSNFSSSAFSLPEDLSTYLEFPEVKMKSTSEEA